MKKKLLGATLATTAALAFAVVPVTTTMAAEMHNGITCIGGNACKGQSACKTAQNTCKGHNSCKGKGFVITKSKTECEKQGGTVKK